MRESGGKVCTLLHNGLLLVSCEGVVLLGTAGLIREKRAEEESRKEKVLLVGGILMKRMP